MENRKISVIICLNKASDYEGGVFKLISLNQHFKFDIGDAMIFDSNLLHGVEPITSGTRMVLISFMWDKNGESVRKSIKNSYIP